MLKDILAISGHPGLYKLVSQTKNGVIVENLESKKRMPAYSTSKISALEDIAIYTDDGEDQPLIDVFTSIKEKVGDEAAISHKSSGNELKAYFAEVLPNFDQDRVYVSDIKKVLQWYNVLQSINMIDDILKAAKEETKEESDASKAE